VVWMIVGLGVVGGGNAEPLDMSTLLYLLRMKMVSIYYCAWLHNIVTIVLGIMNY
jgi:hypothetical protein